MRSPALTFNENKGGRDSGLSVQLLQARRQSIYGERPSLYFGKVPRLLMFNCRLPRSCSTSYCARWGQWPKYSPEWLRNICTKFDFSGREMHRAGHLNSLPRFAIRFVLSTRKRDISRYYSDQVKVELWKKAYNRHYTICWNGQVNVTCNTGQRDEEHRPIVHHLVS